MLWMVDHEVSSRPFVGGGDSWTGGGEVSPYLDVGLGRRGWPCQDDGEVREYVVGRGMTGLVEEVIWDPDGADVEFEEGSNLGVLKSIL